MRATRARHATRRRLLTVALASVTIVTAAGCGDRSPTTAVETGTTPPPGETTSAPETASVESPAPVGPLRVAVLADCRGPLSGLYEQTLGAANAAFATHAGGIPAGTSPSDGMTGIVAGGRALEIVDYGCADGTADGTVAEARRLIEEQGAQILLGPPSADGGLAVARLALEHPEVVFLDGGSEAQETTLAVRAPNVFRFAGDAAQGAAGLGDYARSTLGWGRAAVVGEDTLTGTTAVAGFVAEFCGLGGVVTTRLWAPPGEEDFAPYVAELPIDVDGYLVGLSGPSLVAFVDSFARLAGKVDPRRFLGTAGWVDRETLDAIGPQLQGAVVATSTPTGATGLGKVTRYGRLVRQLYPSLETGPSRFLAAYFNAGTALVAALAETGGEVGPALFDAIAGVQLDTAYGLVELDGNRNGIADNFLVEVVPAKAREGFAARTLLRVPAVEESFGGTFTASTQPPDRANPPCRALDAPPWAGTAVPVGRRDGQR